MGDSSDRATSCGDEGCPCYGRPTDLPRICPLCDKAFAVGWTGIDRHYRTQHEAVTGEAYEDWWARICDRHKRVPVVVSVEPGCVLVLLASLMLLGWVLG